jgi:hypothetical protein
MLTLHTERPLPAGWPGTGARARATSATAERVVIEVDEVGMVPALLDRARAAGGEVLDLALHRPDLADVFFHLTGHELRDGDAPEGPEP